MNLTDLKQKPVIAISGGETTFAHGTPIPCLVLSADTVIGGHPNSSQMSELTGIGYRHHRTFSIHEGHAYRDYNDDNFPLQAPHWSVQTSISENWSYWLAQLAHDRKKKRMIGPGPICALGHTYGISFVPRGRSTVQFVIWPKKTFGIGLSVIKGLFGRRSTHVAGSLAYADTVIVSSAISPST